MSHSPEVPPVRRRPAVYLCGVWLLVALPARAAGVFYVDNTSASCSDAGPGTQAQPYCTISAAVAAQGGPGTTILVKPGTYREQVTIAASGAQGSPLVIEALGGPVVVDGADDFSAASNWVPFSGGVYLAAGVTWSPAQVFMDGTQLAPSTESPASLPDHSFTWVSGEGLYVNTGTGSPSLHQLLVGRRSYGFLAVGRSYITIDGFTVTRAENRCLQFNSGCANVVISHNVVTFAYRYGIQAVGGSGFLIDSNVVSDNDDHGIMLLSGVTASTIQGNESFRNARPTERAANGIHLFGCPGNVIRNNRTHDNQDSGIQIDSESDGCILIQNRSWANGDHGFANIFSTGGEHVGDVAFWNANEGFSIQGGATGTVLYDCIAADNGLSTSSFDLLVDSTSTAGFVSDDNIFWNSTAQPPIRYSTTTYPTISGFSAVSGQDVHSTQADPAFTNPWAGDFRLVAGSPAIDAANSGVPNWPATDAEGHIRVDDPSTPNTGTGPLVYSDRGALEFHATQVVVRPIASLVVTPALGTEPVTVTADASGSSAPGGSIVSYQFDFGDGGILGPQAAPTAAHVYAAGSWVATVVVTDSQGAAQSASVPVVVASSGTGANMCLNPSFEEDLDGWNAFGECTLSRVQGGHDGDWALQMSATGSSRATFGVNDHPDWVRNVSAAGLNYLFSAWVKAATSGGRAVITVHEYMIPTGQLMGSAVSTQAILSPSWQMIALEYVTASPGTTLDFQVREYPPAAGAVFLTDDIWIGLITPSPNTGVGPASFPLAPLVYPSPFRSTATLRFATSQPGPLRVDVFDLAGRRVRRLIDDAFAPAGVHSLGIGRDRRDGGEPFGPGIYFYRIEAREGSRTGRFVVLK